jgi:GntR family transcriptional repressor for pyruvate dehydrogenase complex
MKPAAPRPRTSLRPVRRKSLVDDVVERLRLLIDERAGKAGDRLPTIAALAAEFGVGSPTVREALQRLEIGGVVTIRHGSGVFVAEGGGEALVVASPVQGREVTKAMLLDLIEARTPIELRTAELAARRATARHLAEIKRLLAVARANLQDDQLLNRTNMAFHRQIALASGNAVLAQLLDALTGLFAVEQRMIIDIQDSREADHAEHVAIYEALRRRNAALARSRMQAHLDGVRRDLKRWNPRTHPVW